MTSCDVLIAGGGMAGLTAAVSAAEVGARVVLLEAASELGGAARLSMGIFVAPQTGAQRRAGIVDSPDSMFRDYMTVNQWSLPGGVVRRLTEESGPAVDWLESLGVEFWPKLVQAGADSVPRGAHAVGNGGAPIEILAAAARKSGVEIVLSTRADSLIVEDGTVRGLRAGSMEYRASSIVLATGGLGASPNKVADLYPSASKAGDWALYIGPETNRGDGLDIAAAVDAGLAGVDTGCLMLTPGFSEQRETYLPGWLVLVDQRGKRFVAEDAHYSILDRQAHRHGGRFWAIFDGCALDDVTAARTPSYAGSASSYQGQPARTSPSWNPRTLREMRAAGRLESAPTIEGLAEATGVPADQLGATIELYNRGADLGVDSLAKAPEFLRPIREPPYFAAEVRHAQIIITGAGLAIDAEANVLDTLGLPIPGLFAAGETTGGIIWPFYPSSGSSLGLALAYGRIAARSAVTYASMSPHAMPGM